MVFHLDKKLSDMYTSIFDYAMNFPAVPVIALFRTSQQSETFDQKLGLDGSPSASGLAGDFATDAGVFKPVRIHQQWPDVYSRNFLPGLLRGPPGKSIK